MDFACGEARQAVFSNAGFLGETLRLIIQWAQFWPTGPSPASIPKAWKAGGGEAPKVLNCLAAW